MWLIILLLLACLIKYVCLPVGVIVLAYLVIKKINEKKAPAKKAEEKEN